MIVKIFSRLKKLNKKQRLIAFGSAGFVLIMAIQLLLPAGLILPRVKLDGQNIGLHSKDDVIGQINNATQTLRLDLNGKIHEILTQEAGIYIDANSTIQQLPSLDWGDKITPLWPFVKMIMPVEVKTMSNKDSQKIKQFARGISKELYRKPVDAKATFKDGQLIIDPEDNGWEYPAESIAQTLESDGTGLTSAIHINGKVVTAGVTGQDLDPLKGQFQKITSQTLKINYGDKQTDVSRDTITSWLAPQKIEDDWQIVVSADLLSKSFDEWSVDFNLPAGTTQVYMLDDAETSRVNGVPGRVLDKDTIILQLNEWLQKPNSEPLILAQKEIAPKVNITRTYSSPSARLQSQLNAWIANHSGRYQIAIRELGGGGREASYNASEPTVMASTYKTFLAFVAYNLSESGELNLDHILAVGKSINHCIEDMIVVSDNPCAVELGNYIGWSKVDQIIAAAGFSGVKLNNYDNGGDKLANAEQQARLLVELSSGSLINGNNTDILLGLMKRHTYRAGIPAGSRGAIVANKVGFLDSYIHDTGIVYGPKSTYVLVIMSEYSSWSSIRDLAQDVYDFMNE